MFDFGEPKDKIAIFLNYVLSWAIVFMLSFLFLVIMYSGVVACQILEINMLDVFEIAGCCSISSVCVQLGHYKFFRRKVLPQQEPENEINSSNVSRCYYSIHTPNSPSDMDRFRELWYREQSMSTYVVRVPITSENVNKTIDIVLCGVDLSDISCDEDINYLKGICGINDRIGV